jgi:hypothetical protein
MNAVGSRGTSVKDYFDKNGPTAYLGTLMPGFPNLFRLYGSYVPGRFITRITYDHFFRS